MSNVDLSSYIEVPERIRDFIAKYPDGSLQCEAVEYRDLPTPDGKLKMHVIYHALAYRTPDDPRPGHGMASEPLPGLTPYTKGSELMNAETSAWGRALAALGFVSKRDGSAGVVTANEVRARQDGPGRTQEGVTASEKQVGYLKKLIKQKKASVPQLNFMLIEVGATGVTVQDGWTEKLGVGPASGLIEWLKEKPLPDVENPSDVPGYGEGEFAPPAPGDGDVPFDEEKAA
jgi:hypothetical protein